MDILTYQRSFQRVCSILDVGLCGSCWWAVPQPRSLSFKTSLQASLGESRHMSVFHYWHGTARTIRAELIMLNRGAIWLASMRTLQRCGTESRIQVSNSCWETRNMSVFHYWHETARTIRAELITLNRGVIWLASMCTLRWSKAESRIQVPNSYWETRRPQS